MSALLNSIGYLNYVFIITCDLHRAIKRCSCLNGLNQIDSVRPVKKEGGRTLQLSGVIQLRPSIFVSIQCAQVCSGIYLCPDANRNG